MKNKFIPFYFLLSLWLLGRGHTAQAQHELTMPFMHNLMQSAYTNPTLVSEYKVSVAFAPFFPSVSAGIRNTGFSLKDLIRNDTIYLPKMLPKLKSHNYLYTGTSLEWLAVRIKANNLHWSFNITEQINARFSYPDNFARFAVNGNHTEEFYQKTVHFKGLGLNAMHYREFAVGLTVDEWDNKLIFGGRAKMLFGKSNAYTSKTNVNVFSADTLIHLDNDVIINTSSPWDTGGTTTAKKYLFNNRNIGFALDGGVSYEPNTKWKFTFTFNNVGFIRWKDNVTNRRMRANVAYSGVKLQSIILNQSEQYNKANVDFDMTKDSLSKRFEPEETHDSYVTPLVGQTYFLAEYKIDKNSEVGGGVYAEYFQGVRTSWTLNYQRRFGRVFNLIGSYSVHNRTFDNIGLGTMLKLGNVQLYFVGDNLIGIARGTDAHNFNLRFGLNFVMGLAKPDL